MSACTFGCYLNSDEDDCCECRLDDDDEDGEDDNDKVNPSI